MRIAEWNQITDHGLTLEGVKVDKIEIKSKSKEKTCKSVQHH